MNDADFEVWLAGQVLHATQERERIENEGANADRVDAINAFLSQPVEKITEKRVKSPQRKKRRRLEVVKKPVSLLGGQVEHLERLRTILRRFPFALDFSMLGAGKTYTSAYLAQHGVDGVPFKSIVVICPVSVLAKWKFMQEEFGLPITHAIGYQELRSRSCHQPKHGLLHRRDYTVTHELLAPVARVEFTCSDEYRAMVDEGMLLVVDEVQNIKNVSSQFLAAQTLIKEVTRRVGSGLVHPTLLQRAMGAVTVCPSRVVLLSGSPIDQKQHATHLFRALGVMTADRVAQFNIHTRANDWRGMREIHSFCHSIDAVATAAVPPQYRESKLDPYIYRLFQGILKPACASAMTSSSTATLLKQNAFYNIDDEGAVILKRGLYNLSGAARFNGSTVQFGPTLGVLDPEAGGVSAAHQLAGVSRAMQIIETGKIQLFIRVVRETLESMPTGKVVVAVNFVDTVTDLQEALRDYAPLLLVGSTTHNRRRVVMELFQTPSTAYRLLICNQSVASTGIDLDDKHGGYPRVCFVSPNYSTITSYQLGHRFLRLDTRSAATVRFVYAKHSGKTADESEDIIELPVLNALSKKSVIMKETTTEQVAAGIVFPGDHPEWEEEVIQHAFT